MLYRESALGKTGGLSGVSEALAVTGFTAAMAFAIIAATGFAGALGAVAGFTTPIGALNLVFFTLPASVFVHVLWTLEGAEIGGEYLQFMKKLGVRGGSHPGSGSVLARRVAQSPRGGRLKCG